MKFSVSLLAAGLVFVTGDVAVAQLRNAGGNAEVAKVEQANKEVSSIQCKFSRTTKVAALKDAAKVDGDFFFQAPKNLSMKYSDGEAFVVTEDNVSMSVGGRARTLRSSNRNVEDLSATLLSCIKGQVSAIDGKLASAKTVGKNIVFKIDTDLRVGRNTVNSVELAYDKVSLTLVSLRLTEADGSYTLYELKDKSLNKQIDASVFAHAKKRRG